MRLVSVCVIALSLLCVSAPETQARDGFFSRLFNRSSGGSSGQSVAPVASYGSSGASVAPVASYGSAGASTSGGSSGSISRTRLRLRLVPVTRTLPLSSQVYETGAGCPNCVK
jgi:hypothetical protein